MRPAVARSIALGARGLASRIANIRPAALLIPLCLVQVALALGFAFSTPHNGWVWYSGGDATEYWADQWSVAHFLLPQAYISWALPVLYAWVPPVAGLTLAQGLPVIVLLQALVLVPLATLLVWAVADRLFGRTFAAWATVFWVVAPLLFVWGLQPGYRSEFVQVFLVPHWYGFTNMADFPSLVVVLACAWAALRAADTGRTADGVLAGLLLGLLIGLKPANGFFVPAALLLLVAARRPRALAAAAAATAPALLTLLLWKLRGLGHLPAGAYAPAREALGPGRPLLAASPLHYLPWDPHYLGQEFHDLDARFWSMRLLEFLAVAGAVGAIRRDRARGLFLVLWFAAYGVVKGSSTQSSITSLSYFRLTEPGLPAYVLLAASCAFLVPRGARRFAPLVTRAARPVPRAALAALVVATALVPLAVVAGAAVPRTPRLARAFQAQTVMPISSRLTAHATAAPGGVALTWRPVASGGARVWYVVLAVPTGTSGCTPPTQGVNECVLWTLTQVAVTRSTSALVPAGRATYRIGATVGYRDVPGTGDLILIGPPVTVP